MSIFKNYSQLSSPTFDCETHFKEVFEFDEFTFLTVDHTGHYVLPTFYYIRSIIDDERWQDEYINTIKIFDLTIDTAITPEQVQRISAYKFVIQEQLDRQVRFLENINTDILYALKEFFFEHFKLIQSVTKNHIDSKDDLFFSSSVFEYFYTNSIISGEPNKDFIESWKSTLQDLSTPVSKSTINDTSLKLEMLIRNKEPFLIGAERLAAKLHSLNSIILDSVFNNQLMSPEDYRKELRNSKFPDAEIVANKYLERKENKKSKEGYEYIGQIIAVMEETRLYISTEECTNIFGLLSEIERICRVKVKNLTQDIKTVKKWIVFYAKEAGVKNDNPLKRKIEHKINKS